MDFAETYGLPESGLYLISAGAYVYCRDGIFRSVPRPEQIQQFRSVSEAEVEAGRLAKAAGLEAEWNAEKPRLALEAAALGEPLRVKPVADLYSAQQADFDAEETAHENN